MPIREPGRAMMETVPPPPHPRGLRRYPAARGAVRSIAPPKTKKGRFA